MSTPRFLETLLAGEADWTPIRHPAMLEGRPSFLREQPLDGLQHRYYRGPETAVIWVRALFGPRTEGPPNHAHGGCMAALLDELAGGAAWLAGHPVVAATLEVRFRRMLPVGTLVTGRGAVVSASGRRVRVASRLQDAEGRVFAEATGLFSELRPEAVAQLPPESARLLQQLQSELETHGQ